MKRSDTKMEHQPGKYIERATPLGTVTEEMVIKRAKEVAVTNGRNGNDYNQNDYDEAKKELVGVYNERPSDDGDEIQQGAGWLAEGVDHGHEVPTRPAKDEQTFAEELVKEGVEEATHHQMLVGNQQTRGKEK